MVDERDEKLLSSATELATLQAAKDEAEAELDRNFDQTKELLRQRFLHTVRQTHVLYGGLSASSAFDLDHEVYQGRIMPISGMKALGVSKLGQLGVMKTRFAFGWVVAFVFSLLRGWGVVSLFSY
ncbi:hypothetical protein VNO80_26879 [Phaseolus coccineus]|uniref:Uncharacterized protein n=1 Tax=Phaseolus coccineus TaxID=3886 RepID=A0AAN9LKL8_PHACN